MTDQTHSGSPSSGNLASGETDAGGEPIATHVCYLPYDAGDENHSNNRLGLRAIEPPPTASHAIRGNLYVHIELVQPSQQQNSIYPAIELYAISERLLGLMQTTYYTAKGAQTSVMEQAISQVDQALQQINRENPQGMLRAGITCASLLKNKLTITCSGPALALIASDSTLEQFPWHQSAPDVTLGGPEEPKIHSHRRQVEGNIAFFVGSSRWLDSLTVRKLMGTVAATTMDDCDDVAAYLTEQAGEERLPALLVAAGLPLLAAPTQPPSPTAAQPTSRPSNATVESGPRSVPPTQVRRNPLTPNQGSRATAASDQPAKRPPTSLPTAVNATPPVVSAPETEQPSTSFEQTQEIEQAVELRPGPAQTQREKRQPGGRQADPQQPATDVGRSDSPPASVSAEDYQYSRQGAREREYVHLHEDSVDEFAPHLDEPSSTRAGSHHQDLSRQQTVVHSETTEARVPFTERIRASIAPQVDRARGFFRRLLPSERASSTRWEGGQPIGFDQQPIQRDIESQYEHGQTQAPSSSGLSTDGPEADYSGTSPSEREHRGARGYTPPPPASGSRARVIISLAIILALLVFAVVYVAVWRQGIAAMQQAQDLITAAEGNLNEARANVLDGNDGDARVALQRAQGYLFEAENLRGRSGEIDTLNVQITQELQKILQVTPLYSLVAPLVTFPIEAEPHRVLVVDQDIYVLDIGQDQIIRYRLDETRSNVPDQAGAIVLKQGQNVEGINVGPLIDIAWQAPIPGVMDKANLLVLDGNNSVFRYNQRVDGAALQTFGEQGNWQTPTQIQTYIGRFYVADGGRGQIYRYTPGAYDQPPQPWLQVPQASTVSSLASMMIDGDIWLLFNEGLLLRFNQGEQQPFELENNVGRITEPVDLFVGNQENSLIYLADAGEERILVFAKDGTYIQQLQAAEGNPLQELRGIFVDETSRVIYMLTRRGLFQHPLVE